MWVSKGEWDYIHREFRRLEETLAREQDRHWGLEGRFDLLLDYLNVEIKHQPSKREIVKKGKK